METWEKCITLEHFISDFTPKGFKEPIKDFDYVLSITEDNYKFIEAHYKTGDLENALKTYTELSLGGLKLPSRFNKPYIISAIMEYFKRENS